MNILDLVTFVGGVTAVMIIFVAKTNIEQSKVRVKVPVKTKR